MAVPHSHLPVSGTRQLKWALLIVLVFMVVEVVGGLLSNSLALLSDAGHMLVDALALGLSLFAISMASRPATKTRTYGFHRVEILATLANGVTLVLISLFIFYEAFQRFFNPPEVRTPLMLLVATLGLFANLGQIWLLRRVSRGKLNIKSAYWHVLGDAISSLGVIAAGVVIALSGWYIADPIIAILIGGVILFGAVRLVSESVDILLEAAPRDIPTDEVVARIKNVPGIGDVHDVHIWTITSGIHALSAHLVIGDQAVSRSTKLIEQVNQDLAEYFAINHTTFQLECEKCESCPGLICDMASTAINRGRNSRQP